VGVTLDRFPLAVLPTPLVPARRLPGLYVKRDDLTGFAGAGHKARPLEFLLGAALAGRHDVLVTGGGPGSNFCAAAAAAATTAGIGCELVLYGDPPVNVHPNLALALACGANVRYTGDPVRSSVDTAVVEVAVELEAAGRRPYAVPRGGAIAAGTVGMVVAAEELAAQLDEASIEPEVVVIACGSGTTCAGLAVGTALCGGTWRVLGASVSRPVDTARPEIEALAESCGALLGVGAGPFDLVDAIGPGFGIPSEAGERAAGVALRTEGLLLDPVYTAKAFAVVLDLIDEGAGPVVFWHTGGLLAAAAHLEDTP
jgi:1-aminocyclopropane-1-carboxylate deaminase/D-cysteine desulfhydrase-like pyridoxal-dependent ACC family enzyme